MNEYVRVDTSEKNWKVQTKQSISYPRGYKGEGETGEENRDNINFFPYMFLSCLAC